MVFVKTIHLYNQQHYAMKKLLYPVLLFLFCNCAEAQDTTHEKKFGVGDSHVKLLTTCYTPCEPNVLFLNVHENENTSVKAAEDFLPALGGSLYRLQHSGERNITFNLNNQKYVVDPNRIYTRAGLKASLIKNSTYTKEAAAAVQLLADEILEQVDKYKLVIALHNNTDKNFSILDYKKGGSEAKNTALLYINPTMDPDDFILTTEHAIYRQLKKQNITVILQDNKNAIDDGSLSVYAGRKRKPYINVEAQEGHKAEQLRMLKALETAVRSYMQ
jgi:hypothetical protein